MCYSGNEHPIWYDLQDATVWIEGQITPIKNVRDFDFFFVCDFFGVFFVFVGGMMDITGKLQSLSEISWFVEAFGWFCVVLFEGKLRMKNA